jgi:hypothetical protein
MSKKILVFALCALLLTLSIPAEAQQAKVYRVAVLFPPGSPEGRPELNGLRDGLRKDGY